VPLALPDMRVEFAGERLPLTYANFYIANGLVVVPTYGDANDARALEILRPLFPGREVRGVPARHLITGGGAFHCVTQQQPAGLIVGGADVQASQHTSTT
jgi:agmatine deiminase